MSAPPDTGLTEAQPTGLYVHWPYCARVCPYCDFNVTRARGVDEDAWGTAFEADLAYLRDRYGPRPLVSLYLGGGTPSLMSPGLIGRLTTAADRLFGLVPGAEVTLEANPGDVDEGALAAWRAAGVNRLSLGVQSFEDSQLAFLGRNHDGAAARRAVDLTLAAFERSTFDLIYALPGEGVAAWEARLRDALATGARHLSLYQLTVEPGTAFARAVSRGDWAPPSEALDADLYEATAAATTAAGLPPYEVSSHAVPGHEAVHNALYWRGSDWLAIGPGAHGRLTVPEERASGGRVATEGARAIGAYLGAGPPGRLREEALGPDEVLTEALAGGLRVTAGVEAARLGPAGDAVLAAAAPLIADGLLTRRDGRLAATPAGRLVLDAVTGALLAAV